MVTRRSTHPWSKNDPHGPPAGVCMASFVVPVTCGAYLALEEDEDTRSKEMIERIMKMTCKAHRRSILDMEHGFIEN